MRDFLLSIGVKKEDISSCVINEKGVFIPTYDSEGNIMVTAQENYDECIKQNDIYLKEIKTNEQLTEESQQLSSLLTQVIIKSL